MYLAWELEPWRVQGRRRFLQCQKPSKKSEGMASAELTIKCLREKSAQKMLRKATRKLISEKAKHHPKEHRQMNRTGIRMARTARKAGHVFVPAEPNWHLSRIRGIDGVSPRVRKVLLLLRLRQIFKGTLVKLNRLP